MKKWRLLLFLLPIIAVALYMRSLASWRPQVVFAGKGKTWYLAFSDDGQTLLAGHMWQDQAPVVVTALEPHNYFKTLWQRKDSARLQTPPQFFDQDSKVLVQGEEMQILDAKTGQLSKDYGGLSRRSEISPDGRWLAFNGFFIGDGTTSDGRVCLNPAHEKYQYINGIVAEKIIGSSKGGASAYTFSPDGNTFLMGIGNAKGAHLDFYDAKTWKLTRTWTNLKRNSSEQSLFYEILEWSHNGKYILSSLLQFGGDSETFVETSVWRTSDGKKLASSSSLNDFDTLLLVMRDDGCVLKFDNKGHLSLRGGANLNSQSSQWLHLPNEKILCAAISPDGSYLMVGTQSGRVFRQRVK